MSKPGNVQRFREQYRRFAFVACAALIVLISIAMLVPFLGAFLWAAVISVLLSPIHRRLLQRFSPNASAALATLIAIVVIGVPLAVIGSLVVLQAGRVVSDMKAKSEAPVGSSTVAQILERVDESIKPISERIGADGFSTTLFYKENREDVVRYLSGWVAKAAAGLIQGLLMIVIALITMYYLMRDGWRLREPTLELLPLPREQSEMVLQRMYDTIHAVFIGVVLVAILQGVVAAVGYAIVGLPNWTLWGLITTIACVIPLVGAPAVYIPATLYLLANGKNWQAFLILGLGIAISQFDNFFRPAVISARIKQHELPLFFSLMGGAVVMGPIGLIGGPVVLVLALAVIDVIRFRLKLAAEEDAATLASESPT
ncbi:MAG: AI-2E family transporter [Fimbriimonadaceae bacterium]